jgi:hypothetical protein
MCVDRSGSHVLIDGVMTQRRGIGSDEPEVDNSLCRMAVGSSRSMALGDEELMPATMIPSMSQSMATREARWTTRVIMVLKAHQHVAGFAAASAS